MGKKEKRSERRVRKDINFAEVQVSKKRGTTDESVASQFLITFNTNTAFSEISERSVYERQAMEELLHRLQRKNATRLWAAMMKIAQPGKRYGKTSERTMQVDVHADLYEELKKMFVVKVLEAAVEVGTKQKRLHGHIFIRVTHKSRLHLDKEKILTVFNDQLYKIAQRKGVAIPVTIKYVNIKFIPSDRYAVKNYVAKTLNQEDRRVVEQLSEKM